MTQQVQVPEDHWGQDNDRLLRSDEVVPVRTVTAHIAVPADWSDVQVAELVRDMNNRVARPQGVEIYSHAFTPVWGQAS